MDRPAFLPPRGIDGYDVYAAGMEASAADKAKLLAFVKPGRIASLGCGTGTVLELLRRAFPGSSLVGLDASPEMVDRCHRRFPEGVEVRRHDITERAFDDATVDTILLCSILHEVFSYKGYDLSFVRKTLRLCAAALRPGGRLVIRDGVQPARQDAVYVTFRNDRTREKFFRFAREFGSSEIVWREVDGKVQVARRDAMEFLSKYLYDRNWAVEVKEHFGVLPLVRWVDEVRDAGLDVIRSESYLIDWLRVTHWEKDVVLEERGPEGYRVTDWPHSTMVLVGEKR